MRVLWIDDDRLYIRPLIDDMIDLGHEVSQVSNVVDGFQRIQQDANQFELIILDIMMPARGDFQVDEANGGLRTGLVVLSKIQQQQPEILNKMLVVSIVRDADAVMKTKEFGVSYLFKSVASVERILEVIG